MEYKYLVANQQQNGGWGVVVIDGAEPTPANMGAVENRLEYRLNQLAKDGWEIVTSAANQSTLTVMLVKR